MTIPDMDAYVTWKDLSAITNKYEERIGTIEGQGKILIALGLSNLTTILVLAGLLVNHILK
jgi:hypothetical protein